MALELLELLTINLKTNLYLVCKTLPLQKNLKNGRY